MQIIAITKRENREHEEEEIIQEIHQENSPELKNMNI